MKKLKWIECLVCGYVGKSQRITPQYKRHWKMGLFLCQEICPYCGDTAIIEGDKR